MVIVKVYQATEDPKEVTCFGKITILASAVELWS